MSLFMSEEAVEPLRQRIEQEISKAVGVSLFRHLRTINKLAELAAAMQN
jgi:hypothetical protein